MNDLLTPTDRSDIVHAAMTAAETISNDARLHFQELTCEQSRPSVLYRPRIFIDGDKWCVLYGDNIQDGVTGFGDSPAKAMEEFDTNWVTLS